MPPLRISQNKAFGAGSALIFKGSGFYQTDYRSESYKKAEKSEKSAADTGTTKKETTAKNKDKKSAGRTESDTKGKNTQYP